MIRPVLLFLALLLAPPAWAWEAEHAEALEAARAEAPDLERAVGAAEPRRTRAGLLRFLDEATSEADAVPFLVGRLREGGDPPAVRAALARLVAAHAEGREAWILGLLAEETTPEVSLALLAGIRRMAPREARAALALALADADPGVRAAGAGLVGYLEEGAALAPALSPLLKDRAPEVRAMAARSLGWLEVPDPVLADLLEDGSAEVRLQAISALERIDDRAAAELPALRALIDDPDPRISRAARRVVEGR